MPTRTPKQTIAQQIINHLHAIAPRDATMVQIRNAIAPAADANRFSGTLNTLANRGGVTRKKRRGHTYYAAITGVHVVPKSPSGLNLRRQQRAPLGGAKQAAKDGTAKTLANTLASHCPQRQASARIAQDIAEFQRRGGKIERLGNTPIRHN